MSPNEVSFSIASHAAWAPGLDTPEAWASWAEAPVPIVAGASEPGVKQMSSMLRRRAGFLGKMALEVAYQCVDGRTGVPTVFCSRHGDLSRAVDLLTELAQNAPLSPTGFGLAVHNACAGLFSIARGDHANHLALAAEDTTIEHAVIEACTLLADGEPEVLLVAYENCLPEVFSQFGDCVEQPYAWAWLLRPAGDTGQAGNNTVRLSWCALPEAHYDAADANTMPPGLAVWRFHVRADQMLERSAARRLWRWSRDA